jgi:HK97 family phage portal protein
MFDWLRRGVRAAFNPGSLRQDDNFGSSFRTGYTSSGVFIQSAEDVLRSDVALACVKYLSESVAQCPWQLHKRVPEGGGILATNHPLYNVLEHRANPELTAFKFKESMMYAAVLTGNSYAIIDWSPSQRYATALWPIKSELVTPVRQPNGFLAYDVQTKNGGVRYASEDIFHIPGFGFGPVGLNLLEYASEIIGWSLASIIFSSTFFKNAGVFSGLVMSERPLDPKGRQELLKRLSQLVVGGPDKKHKIEVLDNKMTFNKLQATPNEAQFVETAVALVPMICRIFGVPPVKVGWREKATYNNVEQDNITAVNDAITPWVCRFEQEAQFKLLSKLERGSYYNKFDLKALLRGDHVARAQYFNLALEKGWRNRDEVRAEEGMGPLPNGLGQMYTVQQQYVDLETLRNKPNVPAMTEPEEEPNEDEVDEAKQPDDTTANRRRVAKPKQSRRSSNGSGHGPN